MNRSHSKSLDTHRRMKSLLPKGATIVPVILASDKTHLSMFSGDKQAWPVYLTIGNIAQDIHRKPSERAMVLLGYLPVTKLHCFAPSEVDAGLSSLPLRHVQAP